MPARFGVGSCLLLTGLLLQFPAAQAETFDYRGICDASAAVALDADHFVVADDESNKLFIYRRGKPESVRDVDIGEELEAPVDKKGKEKEVDLEGAARIGDRIYWIASHSKKDKDRRRFFTTKIVPGSPPTLQQPEEVSKDLVKDMIDAPEFSAYDLKSAAKRRGAEMKDALNIEGLAATPDGDLLIGFRNPIPKGKALIALLKNPNKALKGETAKFGAPIELDLDGNGIRSIDRVGSGYLIAAGPYNDCGSFALYRWSGSPSDDAKKIAASNALGDLRPEVLFAIPNAKAFQILSDDGGVEVNFRECKDLKDDDDKGFRSRRFPLN